MTYICKIELNDSDPKIWREFQFHPEVTFHQLHKIIQMVMGWENSHLYEFHVNGQVIVLPNPFDDMYKVECQYFFIQHKAKILRINKYNEKALVETT